MHVSTASLQHLVQLHQVPLGSNMRKHMQRIRPRLCIVFIVRHQVEPLRPSLERHPYRRTLGKARVCTSPRVSDIPHQRIPVLGGGGGCSGAGRAQVLLLGVGVGCRSQRGGVQHHIAACPSLHTATHCIWDGEVACTQGRERHFGCYLCGSGGGCRRDNLQVLRVFYKKTVPQGRALCAVCTICTTTHTCTAHTHAQFNNNTHLTSPQGCHVHVLGWLYCMCQGNVLPCQRLQAPDTFLS